MDRIEHLRKVMRNLWPVNFLIRPAPSADVLQLKGREYFRRFFSPEGLTGICALSSFIITMLILFFLLQQSFPILQEMGYGQYALFLLNKLGYSDYASILANGNIVTGLINLVTGSTWDPTNFNFGILPLIAGTLVVVGGALLIAIPIGIFSAVHLSEYCPRRVKNIIKPVIELLAGIPSVVYGFVGLTILVPWIASVFSLRSGQSALAGSIILSIMILPTIVTISEDAISAVPRDYKEASLALGATHFQTVWKVLLPAAVSGITASIILAIGRALGETMAVLMVAGGVANIPPLSLQMFFTSVQPMTAAIAAEMGETAVGSAHYSALFGVALVLFGITYFVNFIADIINSRFKKKFGRAK
ncbi:MAG: phosphate ABC transporter permease subunit PstC [Candidatus Freyarchaeum deiterrae]